VLVRAIRKSRNLLEERAVLLGAAVSAVVVMGSVEIVWPGALSIERLLALGAGIALVGWVVSSAASVASDGEPPAGAVVDRVFFTALGAALLLRAIERATNGGREGALVCLALGLVSLASGLVRARNRSSRASRLAGSLRWIVPSAVGGLALCSTIGLQPELVIPAERERDPPGDDRPSVVLVILDTVRADHLKTFGYFRDTMPNLERWASAVLTAERAVSPAGWTSPAHASILSGVPVSLHGIHYSPAPGPLGSKARAGTRWLPERLAFEGYRSVAVAANPLALPGDITGFDQIVLPSRHEWHSSTIAALVDPGFPFLRGASERLRWRVPYPDAEQIVDIVTRAAPAPGSRLFLLVNFLDAHSPYNPPARALESLGAEPARIIDRYLHHRSLTRQWESLAPGAAEDLRDLYDGELRWIDMQLPRLFAWIDEKLGKETVVIVASDHGEELGEENRVGHEYGLSQALLHVPLFVRAPALGRGRLPEVVTLRNLYHFMVQSALGREPGTDVLTREDEYRVVAERYPSDFNARRLGEGYGRAWVALFENGLKGVGPSADGFRLLDVLGSGFDREVPVPESEDAGELRARIDSYWERHRDRRGTAAGESTATKEEMERMRALGYAE
ncbi:MAG: sulfatase-like hydrolase/transferase, partial [Candidatus Eisenbacteria bacterium]